MGNTQWYTCHGCLFLNIKHDAVKEALKRCKYHSMLQCDTHVLSSSTSTFEGKTYDTSVSSRHQKCIMLHFIIIAS